MEFMSDFLSVRRARVARALELDREILVVGAGRPVPLPENTDQCYPFLAHSEYVYLTGLEIAGGVLTFDPLDDTEPGWASFVPEVNEDERVWEGKQQPPGRPLAALEAWLTARRERPLITLGAPLAGV